MRSSSRSPWPPRAHREGSPGARGPRRGGGDLRHLPEYATDHVKQWDKLTYTLDITFQGLLATGFVLMLPLVVRKVRWPYAIYVLAVVGIPIVGTKDWQGTGRYLLAAFPVFA